MKTRKSVTKRFKITRTGKILRRRVGQNHCRAKKSGKRIRKTRRWVEVSKSETKKLKKFLRG